VKILVAVIGDLLFKVNKDYDWLESDNNFEFEWEISISIVSKRQLKIILENCSAHKVKNEIGYVYNETVYYVINYRRKIIRVYAENELEFISSFFNYPLSIMSISEGKLLLHCSAVTKQDELKLFVGPSGIGKSTLANFLAELGYKFFSDDNVFCHNVDGKIVYNNTNPFVKSFDALEYLGVNKCGKKISRQQIINPYYNGSLVKIYFLKRGNTCTFEVQKKKVDFINIYNEICGIEEIPFSIKKRVPIPLIKMIIETSEVYDLMIPDDLVEFKKSKKDLCRVLEH
jgi:hypothetical protein